MKKNMAHDSRFPAWAWWIIGALTILAVSILIFSLVLGVRAGQQQVEVQRRQQIGIAIQRATDFQAEGNLQSALDEYQKILVLDPSNDLARQGIEDLLALARSGQPAALPMATPAATAVIAVAASPLSSPTSAPTTAATPASTVATYWATAQSAARAGRWQEVLTNLLLIQQTDPTFNRIEVTDQLVTAYVNLALEKDNTDKLEEALALYEKALALKPTADIARERDLIEMYLDVLAYTGVEWPVVIQELQAIYALEPDYRDVEQRLQEAHLAYADQLASEEAWCLAQDEYNQAISVVSAPEIVAKRDAAQTQCQLAAGAAPEVTALAILTPGGATAGNASQEADTETPSFIDAGDGPTGGRLLYSAADVVSGRSQIMAQTVGKTTQAQVLLTDAGQPAMRSDGGRLVYRNLRNDMAGLSSFDPDTGLQLRFSNYAEDALPSWNAAGSRIVFASNREGDRRWRIYVMWAEENGGTETLTFGESPDWHSSADLIAFRGCDQSGNRCGLWTIASNGANAAQLTAVPADDRPSWSPTGSFVAFMSNARDGNYEIYTVDASSREVTRLTDSPALDVLPAVSPDGRWVAFASNRDGAWKLYAVPSTGGEARIIAPVLGDLSDFLQHSLEWVN